MRFFKKSEGNIPLLFLVISSLWIIFSDKLILVSNADISTSEITDIQTYKGCFFITAASLMLHLMIKSANKKLKRSQEEYKELFHNIPHPMLILDDTTNKFCRVNKAAIDTYGYSIKEFAELSVKDIRADADNIKSLGRDTQHICRHKKKNNELISSIELSTKISFNQTYATLLSVNDITELEKARREISQRENELNQILNSITDGFFIISPSMVIQKANELFKGMAEVPSDKVEGKNLSDLFPGFEGRYSYKQYLHALDTNTPVQFETYYNKTKKWFHVSAYPFESGLFVFFRDITEQKKAEIQRHQNEQNLLALLNNTDDLIWSVDCKFRYYIFNEPYRKQFQNLFGEEVYVGRSALNPKQGEEHMKKWRSLYERALQGEKFTVDMEFLVGKASYMTTIRFNPILNAEKQIIGAGCFLQNVTDRKLQMRKIEQQNELLKRIAFITSHKVRAPLANILGLTQILDEEDPVSPANYKVIEHIKTSAEQLDIFIKNMVQQTVQANDVDTLL